MSAEQVEVPEVAATEQVDMKVEENAAPAPAAEEKKEEVVAEEKKEEAAPEEEKKEAEEKKEDVETFGEPKPAAAEGESQPKRRSSFFACSCLSSEKKGEAAEAAKPTDSDKPEVEGDTKKDGDAPVDGETEKTKVVDGVPAEAAVDDVKPEAVAAA